MYPMTFSEFLIANNCENLVNYMKSIKNIEKIPDIFFNQLEEKLKAYFIIGGMPEAVQIWVTEKNIELVNNVQKNILKAYESDFSKHTQNSEANKISLIWNSIPSQLAKENKKFLYQTVKEGARAREYEGAFTENYVLNMLTVIFDKVPNYFTFDRHEIDFVIQFQNKIIPIEVKSNKSTNNISLTNYNKKYRNDLSIRFSMNNLAKDTNVLNIPLFMIEYLENLINL